MKKIWVSLFFSIILIFTLCTTAFADLPVLSSLRASGPWVQSISDCDDVATVSYAALSELCSYYNSIGVPCNISVTYRFTSSQPYYYIRCNGSITAYANGGASTFTETVDRTDWVLTNGSTKLVASPYQPEKSLDTILDLLGGNNGGIIYHLSRIDNILSTSIYNVINGISTKLDTLTSVISNGKVLVDNSDVVSAIQSIPAYDDTDIITAINNIPTYDDTNLLSAVTAISDQITEQFGEYDSTYSFPNFSSSGQSFASNKTVSGVLPSAFTSVNPGSRQLLYSPSSTLTLTKERLYTGEGTCISVNSRPCIVPAYGLGYYLEFQFYFSSSQSTGRSEPVQFPQVSFTNYSGKSLTLNRHTGSVYVRPYSRYAYSSHYYFPRWDASGNWLGWSGQNDTFQWTSSSYEPSKRVYLTPPESGTYYIYGTSDTAVPVVYASRFTGFLQSQTDRVVNAVGSIPAPNDYTAQLTAVTDKLDALLEKSSETVVNVINDNTYVPGVLYLDDSNGVVDTTKDGVSLFGGLVRWLWKNVFDGAFDAADITKLDGLFYDPAAAAEEVPDGS